MANGISKITKEKTTVLGVNFQLRSPCEDKGSYTDEEIRDLRINLLDYGSSYEIKSCMVQV